MDLRRSLGHAPALPNPGAARDFAAAHHAEAQSDPLLAAWLRTEMDTAAALVSLGLHAPGRGTEDLAPDRLAQILAESQFRSATWREAAGSGLLLPDYERLVLPRPETLDHEFLFKREQAFIAATGQGPDAWAKEQIGGKAPAVPSFDYKGRSQIAVPELPQRPSRPVPKPEPRPALPPQKKGPRRP